MEIDDENPTNAGGNCQLFCQNSFSPKITSNSIVERETRHRALFKTPPNWLQNYKEKCRSALSARRNEKSDKLVNRFRKINSELFDESNDLESKDGIIRQVMASAWKDCKFEVDYESFAADYEFYLKSLEEELLLDQEKSLDEWEEYNQREIDWMIEHQYSVTCFACEKNFFSLRPVECLESATQVVCDNCQFSFQVNFALNHQQFYARMNQIIDQHNAMHNCGHHLRFELLNQASQSQNIKANCTNCNFHIIFFPST